MTKFEIVVFDNQSYIAINRGFSSFEQAWAFVDSGSSPYRGHPGIAIVKMLPGYEHLHWKVAKAWWNGFEVNVGAVKLSTLLKRVKRENGGPVK